MRTILDLMDGPFRAFFAGASWEAWRAFLAAIFALPMPPSQADVVHRCTGRQTLPDAAARESWMVVGRRGGKSRVAALLAVYLACFRRYKLAPGERGVVMVIAADRRQARVVFRYIKAFIESLPMLAAQLDGEPTKEAINLMNNVSVEVHSASFRAVRGYTVVAAILDEIAFWPTDDAANPDHEIVAALLPAMATIDDALLVALSSPYARRGELWRAYSDHFGRDGDPVLVWQADTQTMNPLVPQSVFDAAHSKDAAAASAEYGAQFRTDVEDLLSREAIAAVTVQGRSVLPPVDGIVYEAFCDPAGGSGTDSFTCAIGHKAADDVAVLDVLLEQKPPFSPAATVMWFADVLKNQYRVSEVRGDRYAGEWPRERFRQYGIDYLVSDKSKSEIYLEFVALLNSRRCELLDCTRLSAQLAGLERRTGWGGKDSVDHGPGRQDDASNSACGVLVYMTAEPLAKIMFARTVGFGSRSGPLDPESSLNPFAREMREATRLNEGL